MTDLTIAPASYPARRAPKGLFAYLALRRQRRALAEMDDRQLQDLGLTRAEALQEANRPLWDAPAHWYR
jgi:uncharacterized protein YjiS (DUF1127 family)